MKKGFQRTKGDEALWLGVCGGLAKKHEWDPFWTRLIMFCLAILTPAVVTIYICGFLFFEEEE